MTNARPLLYLLGPTITDPGAFAPLLDEACRSADIAAVMLRLAAADERTLVNTVKSLAPIAQARGAAVLLAGGGEVDLAAVAARGGADGLHLTAPADWAPWRGRLRDGRILGGGGLKTRDDAMRAGEAGLDYVMFGEPRADGYLPPIDGVIERAEWWAEIFETPCVAYAPRLDALADMAATGAEFVALGDAVWSHPGGPAAALAEASRELATSTGVPA